MAGPCSRARWRLIALALGTIAVAPGVVPASAAGADEAVTYQIDPAHTGAQPTDSLTPPLARRWSIDLGGPVSYALIAGGAIFVTAQNQPVPGPPNPGARLYAFDAQSGHLRWGPITVKAEWSSEAAIAFDRVAGAGRIFVLTNDAWRHGVITAFDAATGAQLWQTTEAHEDGFGNAPLPVNGSLLVTPGYLQQSINELTGAIQWSVPSEWPGGAATPTGMYTADYCGAVRDVSPATGATIWETPSSCWNTLDDLPVISGGRLYTLGASRGQYLPTIYDAATGRIVGHFKADMPPVFDGSIGVFVSGSVVQAQDMMTGAALWSFTGDCDVYTLPMIANGYVYIASAQGNLYALNKRNGILAWSDNLGQRIVGERSPTPPEYPSPASASPALAAGEGLLAVPAATTLTVYGSGGGAWTPAPISGPGPALFEHHLLPYPTGGTAPRPTAIATGSDGKLWFLEPFKNQIGRMSPDGSVVEYDVPTDNSDLTAITRGPDGAIWFTERRGKKVGRITSSGAITEFPVPPMAYEILPCCPAGPYGITSGPDGALWLTNYYGDAIHRMTVNGVITATYQLPQYTAPASITFGPDGNIWFGAAYEIGRIAPDGRGYVHFHLPHYLTLQEVAGQITAGPDGNLWFTENLMDPSHADAGGSGGIGRITPAGVITDFQTPTPGSGPVGIVVGPDGNLWFTEHWPFYHGPNKIGRVTTQGAFREYWVASAPSAPYTAGSWGITVGPDGALWFTESAGNAIGRFDLASPTCPAPPPTASTEPARLPQPERRAVSPAAAVPGPSRIGPPPPPHPTGPAKPFGVRATPIPGRPPAVSSSSLAIPSPDSTEPMIRFMSEAIRELLRLF